MSIAGLILDGLGPGGSPSSMVLDGFAVAAPQPVARTLILDGLGGTVSSLIHQGYSAFPGLSDPPPAGKQYADVTSLTWIGDSVLGNLLPPASLGCVIIADLVDSSGYPIVLNGDGTFIVKAAGDVSPQSFAANLFRPVDQFFWGAWTVNLNPAALPGGGGSSGGGGTPGTGSSAGGTGTIGTPVISNVDPAVQADITNRLYALLPPRWFQS